MSAEKATFLESRAFDLLAASPLIVWYGFAVAGIAFQQFPAILHWHPSLGWNPLLRATTQLSTALFLGVQVVLFLIRRLPLAKAAGFAPRFAGFVGANLVFAFLALPRAILSDGVQAFSSAIVMLATLASILVAVRLGRAFSVLPQARVFVYSGPYKYVRHPLYLAEQIGTWGLMLQFKQPWSILIAVASLAAQFPRMKYEEEILQETFPRYSHYAKNIYQLIPYIY